MSETPVEPVWLFEHSDRTGATFAAAQGLIRMCAPDGTQVTMQLLGEQAYPLDPMDLVAAISLVVGSQLVSVPAVADGWQVLTDPDRIRVGEQIYTPEEGAELAGRIGSALMHRSVQQREANRARVQALATTIAGRPLESLPSQERVKAEAAARRVLAEGV